MTKLVEEIVNFKKKFFRFAEKASTFIILITANMWYFLEFTMTLRKFYKLTLVYRGLVFQNPPPLFRKTNVRKPTPPPKIKRPVTGVPTISIEKTNPSLQKTNPKLQLLGGLQQHPRQQSRACLS
jgi:hypothetical protein